MQRIYIYDRNLKENTNKIIDRGYIGNMSKSQNCDDLFFHFKKSLKRENNVKCDDIQFQFRNLNANKSSHIDTNAKASSLIGKNLDSSYVDVSFLDDNHSFRNNSVTLTNPLNTLFQYIRLITHLDPNLVLKPFRIEQLGDLLITTIEIVKNHKNDEEEVGCENVENIQQKKKGTASDIGIGSHALRHNENKDIQMSEQILSFGHNRDIRIPINKPPGIENEKPQAFNTKESIFIRSRSIEIDSQLRAPQKNAFYTSESKLKHSDLNGAVSNKNYKGNALSLNNMENSSLPQPPIYTPSPPYDTFRILACSCSQSIHYSSINPLPSYNWHGLVNMWTCHSGQSGMFEQFKESKGLETCRVRIRSKGVLFTAFHFLCHINCFTCGCHFPISTKNNDSNTPVSLFYNQIKTNWASNQFIYTAFLEHFQTHTEYHIGKYEIILLDKSIVFLEERDLKLNKCDEIKIRSDYISKKEPESYQEDCLGKQDYIHESNLGEKDHMDRDSGIKQSHCLNIDGPAVSRAGVHQNRSSEQNHISEDTIGKRSDIPKKQRDALYNRDIISNKEFFFVNEQDIRSKPQYNLDHILEENYNKKNQHDNDKKYDIEKDCNKESTCNHDKYHIKEDIFNGTVDKESSNLMKDKNIRQALRIGIRETRKEFNSNLVNEYFKNLIISMIEEFRTDIMICDYNIGYIVE